MDTGVELVGIKNGIGLFYRYSVGEKCDGIDMKEIPLESFKAKVYVCRNFASNKDSAILNGRKFSSIEAMIEYIDSVMRVDSKRNEHTKNGWYFL